MVAPSWMDVHTAFLGGVAVRCSIQKRRGQCTVVSMYLALDQPLTIRTLDQRARGRQSCQRSSALLYAYERRRAIDLRATWEDNVCFRDREKIKTNFIKNGHKLWLADHVISICDRWKFLRAVGHGRSPRPISLAQCASKRITV